MVFTGWPGHLLDPVALCATLTVRLERFTRRACDACGRRRVRFGVTVNGSPATPLLCARCAGMRG